MTIQSFSNEGDSIVTFSPVYGPFFSSVKSHKRNLIDLPLMINNGKFQVPFDRLESILKNFNGLVILVLYLLKQLGVKEVLTLIFLYSDQIVKLTILTETLEF